MNERGTRKNLEQVLFGAADVFGVALVVTDGNGGGLTSWQYPTEKDPPSSDDRIVPVKDVEYNKSNTGVINCGGGRRRFVVRLPELVEETVFIQSGDLPKHFAWTDGKVLPQEVPGSKVSMEEKADFLLGVFLSIICKVVVEERDDAMPINNIDVENIRRIGISLRQKIVYKQNNSKSGSFSLAGVPSINAFFFHEGPNQNVSMLAEALGSITKDLKGAFNLLSLTSDLMIKPNYRVQLCHQIHEKHFGHKCFASDIECLIKAALTSGICDGIPVAVRKKCFAGFTEVVAPIIIDGLIVGLVFGGQLIETQQDARNIHKFANIELRETNLDTSEFKPTGKKNIEKTEQVVSGLSALIGLMVERYCMAHIEAGMQEELLGLASEKPREIFRKACFAVKKFLAASDCTAFRFDGEHLLLEATTAKELYIRQKARGLSKKVPAKKMIGKAFYKKGEGITGSVVETLQSRFERDATDASGWFGRCSEADAPQVFAVPILHDSECYGVLRAVRPIGFREFPLQHRELMLRFVRELGIVLHNYELTTERAENFKQNAEALQKTLAEASHEFRAPLHNVLSLSTALKYAEPSKTIQIHQMIEEEVFRAKKIMDNYLMRGVSGQKIKYNFESNDIKKLVEECVSRFELIAAKKGKQIIVSPALYFLPKISFDNVRIGQVFTNIIDNAVKYSFDNTEIIIKGKEKATTIVVSVTDKGLGIPREAIKTIFEGYSRTVEDKRKFKPGTGLGLMIAKEIIDAHGGTITVESEPYMRDHIRLARYEGYETTFIISLPKDAKARSKNAD